MAALRNLNLEFIYFIFVNISEVKLVLQSYLLGTAHESLANNKYTTV